MPHSLADRRPWNGDRDVVHPLLRVGAKPRLVVIPAVLTKLFALLIKIHFRDRLRRFRCPAQGDARLSLAIGMERNPSASRRSEAKGRRSKTPRACATDRPCRARPGPVSSRAARTMRPRAPRSPLPAQSADPPSPRSSPPAGALPPRLPPTSPSISTCPAFLPLAASGSRVLRTQASQLSVDRRCPHHFNRFIFLIIGDSSAGLAFNFSRNNSFARLLITSHH